LRELEHTYVREFGIQSDEGDETEGIRKGGAGRPLSFILLLALLHGLLDSSFNK
jgi:hypothetical protein